MSKQIISKNNKPALDIQRAKDHQIVRGIFQNKETRGGQVSFSFKKYKEDDVEHYTFVDGQHYEIPLMVANHLNQNCYVEVHSHTTDEMGRPSTKVGTKEHRFGFINTDFRPVEGYEEQQSGHDMKTLGA